MTWKKRKKRVVVYNRGGLGLRGVLRQSLFEGKNVVAAQWFPCPKMVLEMRPINVFESKSRT